MKHKINLLSFFVFVLLLNPARLLYAHESLIHVAVPYHSDIHEEIVPLVEKMYVKAGINVDWPQASHQRIIEGVNGGLYDANVAQLKTAAGLFENITYVPTPLGQLNVYLLCKKEITCNKNVLQNPDLRVISPTPVKRIKQLYSLKVKIYHVKTDEVALAMLNSERADYVLLALYAKAQVTHLTGNFQQILLSELSLYHALNKKHHKLIPKLDKALQQVLAG